MFTLFLTTLLFVVIFIGLSYIYYKKKRFENLRREIIIGFIDILVALVINVILYLILKNVASKISNSNYIKIYSSIYLAIMIIRPFKIIKSIQLKKLFFIKRAILGFGIILVCFIEIFSFNREAFTQPKDTLKLSQEQLLSSETNGELLDGEINFKAENYIIIDLAIEINNVYIDFKDEQKDAYIKFFSNDVFLVEYQTNPAYEQFNVYEIHAEVDEVLKIVFYVRNDNLRGEDVTVTSITLNVPIPFTFHLSRIIIFSFMIAMTVYMGTFIKNFTLQSHSKTKKLEASIMIIGVIVFLSVIVYAIINRDIYFIKYPLEGNIEDYNIYAKLFDALKKGQLHLDVVPSDGLLDSINPYNPATRGPISFLWDHAYYQGKYYCYYGIAPVLLISFPLYFITGMIPNLIIMQIIGLCIIIPALLLTIIEATKALCKKINMWALYFLLTVSTFTSLSFMNVTFNTYEAIYHTAINYGVAFMMLFIYFSFKGYNQEKRRWLWFLLAGINFVLLVSSRPNLIFTLLFIIPLYLSVLFRRKVTIKKKLQEFIPMISFLTIAGILICTYNYLRFESITEFGQFYQLTIADNQSQRLSFNKILPTIMHYFLHPFEINIDKWGFIFPYIKDSYSFYSFEQHTYINGVIGIFFVPIFSLILFIPACIKKGEKKINAIVLYLMLGTIFLLTLMTYTYAGVLLRYIIDIFPLCTLLAVIVIMKILENNENNHNALKVFIPAFLLLGLISAFITFNLVFNRFDGYSSGDFQGLLLRIRAFFGDYNH